MMQLDLVVARLRRRQERHSFTRRLKSILATDPGLRVLPQLLTLPIQVVRSDGRAHTPADWLTLDGGVMLRGPQGSGRCLLFAHYLQAWIQQEQPWFPLPVDLSVLDDGVASPHALLMALVAELHEVGRSPEWRLLLSGWEDLPPQRRAIWRATLIVGTLPHSVRLGVVIVPSEEPHWPGLLGLSVVPPSHADIAAWCVHLAPQAPERELRALAGPEPCVGSIGMAAWLYLQGGHATTRADQARLARRLLGPDLILAVKQRPAIGVGLLAHYTGQLRLLEEAEHIAVADRTDRYGAVAAHPARAELLELLTGLVSTSDRLLTSLWPSFQQDQQLLLLAGRILAENPPQSAVIILRIIEALGRRAAAGDADAAEILGLCGATIDSALVTASGRRAFRTVAKVLTALPDELAAPRLVRLVFDAGTPDRIAWAMVERLIGMGRGDMLSEYAPPGDEIGLMRWALIQALDQTNGHARLLATGPGLVLRALARAPRARRARATALLTANHTLPPVVRMAALSLFEETDTAEHSDLVVSLLSDPAHELRSAALVRMARRRSWHRMKEMTWAARSSLLAWEARHDVLAAIAPMRGRAISAAIAHCAADQGLPLDIRLQAVQHLVAQHAPGRLLRLVRTVQCHPLIRAAALAALVGMRSLPDGRRAYERRPREKAAHGSIRRHVGRRGRRWSLPALIGWVLDDPRTTPLLLAIACEQLGNYGGPIATARLTHMLDRTSDDIALTLAAIAALGQTGDQRAVPALATLLGVDALARLVHACPQSLQRQPTAQALLSGELPPGIGLSLREAVAICLTPADQPTTPHEYLVIAADTIRTAAAQALAQIGGPTARHALVRALTSDETGRAIPALIDALALVCGPDDSSVLSAVMLEPAVTARVRWLAAQRLANHPAAIRPMMDGLRSPSLDSFTRGAIAEGLGRRGISAALSTLVLIAQDRHEEIYLRERAMIGLSQLGGSTAEEHLLRIAASPDETAHLRGFAAAQLGPSMADETRRGLRGLLRGDRIAPDLVIGALHALGRARDRETLPLMLQYSLDERGEVVRAAIEALAQTRDTTISSILVNISQKASADRMVRLHAVGALMRMGDRDCSLLLRDYLNSPSLPIQIQALDQLILSQVETTQLLALAADQHRALAFRLRALEAASASVSSASPLQGMLTDHCEPTELRGRVAQLLATIGGPIAQEALVAVAQRQDDHPGVRLACIDALIRRREPGCAASLGRIVHNETDDITVRERAALALLMCMIPRGGDQ